MKKIEIPIKNLTPNGRSCQNCGKKLLGRKVKNCGSVCQDKVYQVNLKKNVIIGSLKKII